MAEGRGCLKKSLFGCLGLMAVVIVASVAFSLWATNMVKNAQETEEPVLAPLADIENLEHQDAFPVWALGYPGRVIINMQRGEFHITPAERGEPAHVDGRYDPEIHALAENFVMLPDSTWVYQVEFRQIKSGISTWFKGGPDPRVEVFLPMDTPFALDSLVKQGGIEADLGGLWITDADIRYSQGGFALEFSEPLQEPMRTLAIRGTMGGFAGEGLGNASPSALLVRCGMGGADIDLNGDWRNDCTVDLGVTMGGMSARTPRNVDVVLNGDPGDGTLRQANEEVPVPVLTIITRMKMGEVDVSHR